MRFIALALLCPLAAFANTYQFDASTSLTDASAQVYQPGDQILLKAGTTWTEPLEITTSEDSDEPVLIGSYGAGPKPVITASYGTHAPISLTNATNVTISGLTIQNSGGSLIKVTGGSGITVTNCQLINGGLFPVNVTSSPGFKLTNSTYQATGSFLTRGDAVKISGLVSGTTVAGNSITLNDASKGAPGIYVVDVLNAEVSNNTVRGGSQGIGIKGTHRNVTGANVHDNSISGIDNRVGDGEALEFTGRYGYTVSGSIHHNLIQGGPYTGNGIGAYHATNVSAFGNVIIGPLLNSALHWSSNSYGAKIYNNTIYKTKIALAFFSGSSAVIRNNIVAFCSYSTSFSRSSITEDHNIFYASNYHSYHSLTVNPQFVDAGTGVMGLKLAITSPAIGAGYVLASNYKYALDPISNSFPASKLDQAIYGWGIGAWGHQ